ncbi:unnamed protein product [Strongylus vulgaris]|uniref:Uncharacterized protein n=1 Tax=Strongylus vulgaris TaxID=40348 RepID=A0A3P7KP61_STRVU|nr:unnamed protein product [Strongylus vulgaris]
MVCETLTVFPKATVFLLRLSLAGTMFDLVLLVRQDFFGGWVEAFDGELGSDFCSAILSDLSEAEADGGMLADVTRVTDKS